MTRPAGPRSGFYVWLRRCVVGSFALTLLAGSALVWYGTTHFLDPQVLRQMVLRLAAERVPQARVDLASVQGTLLGDFRLDEVSVQLPAEGDGWDDVLHFPRVILSLSRQALWKEGLKLKRVELLRPTLHLHRDAQGEWNIVRLKSRFPLRLTSPVEVSIREATIRVTSDDADWQPLEVTGVEANLKLVPPSRIEFHLRVSDLAGAALAADGSADVGSGRFEIEGRTSQPFDLKRLAPWLEPALAERAHGMTNVNGSLGLRVSASAHTYAGQVQWEGAIAGELLDAAADHPALPFPLRQAHATFTLDRRGAELRQFTGRIGPAEVMLRGAIPKWDRDRLEGEALVRNLPFSDEIYRLLPPREQKLWDQFHPQGSVDIVIRGAAHDTGTRWTGYAELREAQILHERFRYPVHGIEGRLERTDEGWFRVAGKGMAGERPVTLTGTLGPGPAVDLELVCHELPLDDRLAEAMVEEGPRSVYNRFHGVGKANVVARFLRRHEDPKVMTLIDADVTLDRVTCDWFPYELSQATGKLAITPDRVVFRRFVGRAGKGIVHLDGQSIKLTDGPHVEMYLRGHLIPLDARLKRALTPSWQAAWEALQPEGLGSFACTLVKSPDAPLEIAFPQIDLSQAALTPRAFPYRLAGPAGLIQYQDQRVWWDRVIARHGSAIIDCGGEVILSSGGGQLALRDVAIANLPLDGDLRRALPPSLQAVQDFLRPGQPVGLRFRRLESRWYADTSRPPRLDVDGVLEVDRTDLIPAVGFRNATGRLSFVGQCAGNEHHLQGNLDMVSLTVASFTARNLRSRLEARGGLVHLPNVHSEFYGGQLAGSIQVDCGTVPGYQVVLNANDARLRRYVNELTKTPMAIDGVVDGRVVLSGRGRDLGRLAGSGRLHIREADIVHLPVIQDLFKIINLQIPDGRAFDDIDGNFTFHDKQIVIDRLEFTPSEILGPSLSLMLDRPGWIDLETLRMELLLCSRYARGRLRIPFVSDALNIASDQLMKIRVHGTLTHPVTTPEPVPALRRLLAPPSSAADRRR